MTKESDNIELRSEKVKNIIGQIPPRIIRIGIMLIFIIIIVILTGSYFFKYEYTIKTTATIVQKNDTTKIEIKVPANEIAKIKTGQKVVLNFDNISNIYNEQLETVIQVIPKKLHIQGNEAYYLVELIITDSLQTETGKVILVNGKINANAEIITNKISFFDKITEPFQSIFNKK